MEILIVAAVLVLIALFVAALAVSYYHRVPPSEVMVVYGRKEPRLITNGGVFVVPILESYKKLDMRIITIKTERDEVYTISGIPIQLDWVSQVQIDSNEAALRTAARALLDKTPVEIREVIADTLSANFRAIVGQMTVEAIHRDRDDFVTRVQELATDDVQAMGIKIISMGIEEILDNEGYLEAMAAPQIAAVKRDATIAQAEADREARTKAALATQMAEQAELAAQREILQQREELELREVEVQRQVDMARALSDQEVQQKRALAVEQKQEAEVLVPARAEREATEIRAEAERKKLTIEAEARATATRTTAEAEGDATERRGRADAEAFKARRQAEADGQRAEFIAEADGKKADAEALRAQKEAEADGIKAALLAEAEGRRELAAASAAEDEINLRQFMIEQMIQADVEKSRAISEALAGLGGNVRVVQIGNNGNGGGKNTFMDMLLDIPEVAEVFKAKVEALSGDDMESMLGRVTAMMKGLQGIDTESLTASVPVEDPPKKPPAKPSRSAKPNDLPK